MTELVAVVPDPELDAHLDRVLVHGRQPARVQIVGPDPAWPRRYALERTRLVGALGARATTCTTSAAPA